MPFRKAAGNWGDVNRPNERAVLGAGGRQRLAGRADTEANFVSLLQPPVPLPPPLSLSLVLALLSPAVLLLSHLILSHRVGAKPTALSPFCFRVCYTLCRFSAMILIS